MSLFHKHVWQNIKYDYAWIYYDFECSNPERRYSFSYEAIYQKEDPGVQTYNCPIHGENTHHQHPQPKTYITQFCDGCKNYRTQSVIGILEDKSV